MMQYFIDEVGAVHALDSNFNVEFISKNLKIKLNPISNQEFDLLIKPTQAQIEALEKEKAKADLMQLDMATIRAMREYIASKADAPQILKDRETLAAQLRDKLK